MAAALHLPNADNMSLTLQDQYSRRLTITELDLQDARYPSISSSKHKQPSSSSRMPSYNDRSMDTPMSDISRGSWIDYVPATGRYSGYNEAWVGEKLTEEPREQPAPLQAQMRDAAAAPQAQSRTPDGNGTYGSPSGGVPFAYNDDFEGRPHRTSSNNIPASPREPSRVSLDAGAALQSSPEMGQRASGLDQYRDNQYAPSSPRHPSLPTAGIGAGPSTPNMSPIVPMSAGPSYSPAAVAAAMSIAISPKPRAYAQQPTYINSSSANPSYAPPQVSKEEICVECAMRDQDMADVDVTSPGIWERESDALYEDLVRREELEASAGHPPQENTSRPKAKGQILTEEHLKLWLSVNPKEPSSRQQTLDQYVKAQRALLDAEALAHSRAVRESRLLDDKMRDTYSQLRRSAYELGSSAQPDETGGVRIKAPRSTSTPVVATGGHSREVTLLENGMIVEHVDVRKEERDERERRRKEEKRERSRVRKSSRSSRGADVMSVYSLQTPMHTDSGFFSGIRSDSRYSQSYSQRPSSVMTGGNERPSTLLRVQSQASFSDLQSIGAGSTTSPRRSRFFGLKNLSTGWRSQDSLAPSGSMIDMHVALQREQSYLAHIQSDAVDISSNAPTLRLGEAWPPTAPQIEQAERAEVQSTKKRRGLLKFWKLVTGQLDKPATPVGDRTQPRSIERVEDDAPLAPPPPLSYLVSREQGGGSRRHVSTPSLPSAVSPNGLSPYTASPQTAPSSVIPSPTSSRRSTGDKDSEGRKNSDIIGASVEEQPADTSFFESDARGRATLSSYTVSSGNGPMTPPLCLSPTASPSSRPKSAVIRRDKSLPPLPGESSVDFPYQPMPESRPQTLYTYDPRASITMNTLAPPQAPFRTSETRRQSFGGIGSKKPFGAQTLPVKGAFARGQLNVPPFLAEEKCGEFGMSRLSLGQWPGAQFSQGSLQVPGDKPKKRKSRFGLTSLFSKKSLSNDHRDSFVDPLDLSAVRNSQDTRYMSMYVNNHENGYSSPLSASSHAARTSMMSKKNIEELVDQDPDFIAYRYPSNDQRIDLLR